MGQFIIDLFQTASIVGLAATHLWHTLKPHPDTTDNPEA